MSQDALMKQLLGSLSGDELKSHPRKKLIDHLNGTKKIACELAKFHGLDGILPQLTLACLTHDLGKASFAFQEHLRGRGKTEHAAPSSFFTLFLGKSMDSIPLIEVFLTAEAVRRHHTDVEDWRTIEDYWCCNDELYRNVQAKTQAILASTKPKLVIADDEWKSLISSLGDSILWEIDDETPKENLWLHLRLILSCLAASDRMNALNINSPGIKDIPEYKDKIFTPRNEIDLWRGEIYEQCKKAVEKVSSSGIFTLTLPTGAGKTHVGLSAARELAQKFDCKTIIYTMPYISIIEQNVDFVKELFGKEGVQEDHSAALKTPLKTQKDDAGNEDEENKDRMRNYFRYWNAPVVVTTMVHLWEALFNQKANATMNFHRLSRAVVLMDEPQSIDCRFWQQFGKVLDFIHEKLGTIFILMTATQPKIGGGKYQELAQKTKVPVNRHKYRILKEKGYRIDELLPVIQNNVKNYNKRSGMIILNTKKNAYKVYKMLSQKIDAPVFLLSRWLTPVDRREILKEIAAKQKNNERCYLVATQVVEAGVDLDFDWVFREFAPLDSIIQAAGRCNRSGLRDEGFVAVAKIVDDDNKLFAEMVYDDITLNQTEDTLKKYNEFNDADVPEIVDEYYDHLVIRKSKYEIWDEIRNGKWQYRPLWDDKNYNEVQVYIDDDGKVGDLLEDLRETKPSLDNLDDRKNKQRQLDQHRIEVAQKEIDKWDDNFVTDAEEMLEQDNQCYVVRASGVGDDKIYSKISGFQPLLSDETKEYDIY